MKTSTVIYWVLVCLAFAGVIIEALFGGIGGVMWAIAFYAAIKAWKASEQRAELAEENAKAKNG